MAGTSHALRKAPSYGGSPITKPITKPTTVTRPAVWTPAPVSGIKWSGGGSRFAVWIR